MPDATTFTNLVFVAVGLTATTLILRAIRSGDPVDLGSMFPHPWEFDWPRGVQEEEPQPWRLDHLGGTSSEDATRPVELARPVSPPRDDAWDAAA